MKLIPALFNFKKLMILLCLIPFTVFAKEKMKTLCTDSFNIEAAQYEYLIANHSTYKMVFTVEETNEKFIIKPTEERKLYFSISSISLLFSKKNKRLAGISPGVYVLWMGKENSDTLVDTLQIINFDKKKVTKTKKEYTIYLSNDLYERAKVMISGERTVIGSKKNITYKKSTYIPPIFYFEDKCCLEYQVLDDDDEWVYLYAGKFRRETAQWRPKY